jgi:septum formation protein
LYGRIYLASLSPRRRELIKLLGIPVELLEPPRIDEDAFVEGFNGPAHKLPVALAEAKARLVLPKVDDGFLVCADTDVIHDGEALGKPVDSSDAARMLRRLSGDWHEVITGVSVAKAPEGDMLTDASTTRVKFAELGDFEIEKYVASGEPMDKAGAYGIQGLAAPFIERIEGCYFNVVGLPVNMLYGLLKRIGFEFDTNE